MLDVVFVATLIAFFAVMLAFVRWCEHIVGVDDVTTVEPEDDAELPAGDQPTDPDRLRPPSPTPTPEEVSS
jgi:hypothetical protein